MHAKCIGMSWMAPWRVGRALAVLALIFSGAASRGQISYTGGAYTQDFNSLPSAGTYVLAGPGPHAFSAAPIDASGMTGWSFALVPGSTAPDARFTIGSGTSSSGSVFS